MTFISWTPFTHPSNVKDTRGVLYGPYNTIEGPYRKILPVTVGSLQRYNSPLFVSRTSLNDIDNSHLSQLLLTTSDRTGGWRRGSISLTPLLYLKGLSFVVSVVYNLLFSLSNPVQVIRNLFRFLLL